MSYLSEAAYGSALEGIAAGAPRDEVVLHIGRVYGLNAADIDRAVTLALHDAQAQGVERDDIDPSWLRL